MTALDKIWPISVAGYLAGEEVSDEKHEFVQGFAFALPSRTNLHNTIAGNALGVLHAQLRGKPCQPFNGDTKVRIEFPDHTRFYYPDAMVVCHPNPGTDHFQDQPVVVIEVLSDATRRTDLGEKRDAYLTISSLKALLLVEPDTSSVTVYRRRAEGGFAVEHHAGSEDVIPLPEVGALLPLANLYDRV